MRMVFEGKRIEGVLSILPENLYHFEDEVIDPNDPKARRLRGIIGFGSRRRVKRDTTMADMLLFGIRELVKTERLVPDDIGAIIVVTLCQDYILPTISNIIHGEMSLSPDVMCIDIPQACAGYVVGLMESFLLLDHMTSKKVVLCTGEIFNRKAKEEPKTAEPSFGGDIANISIIGNCEKSERSKVYIDLCFDGKQRDSLIIRHGGFRSPLTADMINNHWSNTPIYGFQMDGSGVFNFVQKEVPPMIRSIAEWSNHNIEDFDYFLFHQPNKFMLQKLAIAIGIPFDKLPMDITEKLGNSDSGTIPAVMTSDVSEDLLNKDNLCCLSGFGGGLTWAAIVMNIGHLDFCENIMSVF